MKELSFKGMEKINGGKEYPAGCAVAGVVTSVSVFFIWTGTGAAVLAGALLTSAAMGCFEK